MKNGFPAPMSFRDFRETGPESTIRYLNQPFQPLVVRFVYRRPSDVLQADSSDSCASERDPLSQRFSVSVHPYLPVILSSDGYLVTLMQLPPSASYHGVMTGFMRDVTRYALLNWPFFVPFVTFPF